MARLSLLAVLVCALAHTEVVRAVAEYLQARATPSPAPPAPLIIGPPRGAILPGTYYFWELIEAQLPMGAG